MVVLYKIDQRNIHKNCIHFKDGFCTLNQTYINPNGTACTRFTPKHLAMTGKNEGASLGLNQPDQYYPFQSGQNYFTSSLNAGLDMSRIMQRGGRGRARRISVKSYNLNIPSTESISNEIAQEKQNLTTQLEDLEMKLKDIKQRLEKVD